MKVLVIVASSILLAARNCLGEEEYSFAQPFIVGGDAVSHSSTRYPWFAYFGGCGGSLISDEWVLTAAHCEPAIGAVVRIGTMSLRHNDSNFNQTSVQVGIESFTPHPEYVDYTTGYDYALVKLSEKVDIEPVPFDEAGYSNNLTNTSKLWAIGLGFLEAEGDKPEELMHVELTYIPNEQCNESFTSYHIDDTMLCAADPAQDSCQGDSGGPLWDKEENLLVGVVSWGIGCAHPEYPGIYGRISTVNDWIEDVMNPPMLANRTAECDNSFEMTLFDNSAGNTTYELIKQSDGSVILADAVPATNAFNVNGVTVTEGACLDAGEKYTYKIYSADGLCCSHGNGTYSLTLNGKLLNEGGEFIIDEGVSFMTDGAPVSDDDYYAP